MAAQAFFSFSVEPLLLHAASPVARARNGGRRGRPHGHIDEAQEGVDGSYKELYLKENPHCASSDAEEHMLRMIAGEWEELNRVFFSSRRSFSPSFVQAWLNLARMVSVMYGYDQEQRLPVLDDYIRMLLL